MSTRQTLKNYLSDRGLPGVNTISYNNTIASGDSPDLLDEGDDLSVDPNTGRPLIHVGTATGIVPDYLGYITTGEDNTYPIDGSTYQEAPSSKRGEALQPPEDQGAIDVFKASSEFPVIPSYFDGSGNPVTSIIDKIGDGSAQSGPDLIDEVKAAEINSDLFIGQSKAVTSTFTMLKKYNKYADAALASDPRFVQPASDGGDDTSSTLDDTTTLNFQRSGGEYKIGDTDTSRQTPMRDMHDIAHSMLLKAAGWDTSNTSFTSEDPDGFFDDLDPRTFQKYPNIVRALQPDQVRPRESFGAPIVGESSLLAGAGEAVPRDGADAVYSRSSINAYTSDITFAPSTLDQQAQIAFNHYQAGISIVALAILIQRTINNEKTYTKNGTDLETNGFGPYYMGLTTQSKAESSLRAISNIALTNTGRFAFDRCVRAGVTLYFGINLTSVSTSAPVDGAVGAFIGAEQIVGINTIAEPTINKSVQDRLAQSYGFWQSVARSCVRLISQTESALAESNTTLFANLIIQLLKSKALRIANVFAQIGYTYLIAHLEDPTPDSQASDPQSQTKKLSTAFSMDSFESLPGTRVMKSRDDYARSALSLAWRHGAVPSALLLPPSLIQASLDMDYLLEGPNPVKQLASTTLQDKTYVPVRNVGRIPIEVVNNLENRLDAEYVPFYFQDLRTNEVIGLHAFLDSLTDNYAINFSPTQAYGRADPVKNYSNTKRTISFSYWLVSTSEDDFDEMWAKINKIVSLAYPQYTKGTLMMAQDLEFNLSAGAPRNFTFEQPFSQVVGASPLVRLRIGDVIKSNYSRFNLSRLFGAGNTDTGGEFTIYGLNAGFDTRSVTGLASSNIFANAMMLPLLFVIGSPAETSAISALQTGGPSIAGAALSDGWDLLLKNGFVNPLLPGIMSLQTFGRSNSNPPPDADKFFNSALMGRVFLKPRAEPYVFEKDGTNVFVKVTRPVQISVRGLPTNPAQRTDSDNPGTPASVTIELSNTELDFPIPSSFIHPVENLNILQTGATCNVTLDQCLFDPDSYYSATLASLMVVAQRINVTSLLTQAGTSAANAGLASQGVSTSTTSLLSDFFGSLMRQFTAPNANAITYAMEDSMGRGLAGVFTSINFTWLDPTSAWDVRWNSRAPMACKVTMGFDPIHDISPGLDAYGANRAPIYNVGNTRLVAGDPHKDGGLKSQAFFNRLGAESQLRTKFVEPWAQDAIGWINKKIGG